MKIESSGIPSVRAVIVIAALMLVTGCRSPHMYRAETMPRSLRLAKQINPQEIDISKIASSNGGSDRIGPGDVLDLSIATSLNQDDQVKIPVRISDAGTATIPDIGEVHLAGYEPQAAEALIRGQAINKGLYLNPTITVSIAHKKMNRIRVLGAVKEAGTYELPPGDSDIVSAIAIAGGLAENAGENVEIRNPSSGRRQPRSVIAGSGQEPYSTVSSDVEISGGMTSYTVNLASAAASSDSSYNIQDGGVVMVEKRDPAPVQVLGLVNKPDIYPFPLGKDLTVLGAISMAGGLKNQLADKIYVVRPLANSDQPAVIQVSLRKAELVGDSNVRLGPGDIVIVKQTPATVFLEALQLIRVGVNGTAGLF
ncbi:MAG: SLBB domain-containing protein [Planctomycetaceae bacterium]